jgi:2-polyprenyl-3-methyl-5-hydroxy-6-metoxy-1,4-benzoquinol methylase
MNAMLQPVEAGWFEVTDRCWCGGRSDIPSPHSEHYRVCARCGAHFANRRLKSDCIGKFYSYEGYWQQRQQSKQHPTLWERQQLLEADGRVAHWIKAIERHVGPAPGIAVEAGCAEGTLLLHLRQLGWHTIGIEPDAETATAVHARTGLDVRAGVFPEVAAPACDLFIACDVLEHVPDPLSFLRAARAALRPSGILFLQLPLIETAQPDFGHMTDKVFDPQEHVFIYSREALATLLETAEFEVLENHDAWRRAHEIVVARRLDRPARKVRHLANLPEMFSPEWTGFIDELNAFAAPLGLRQFTNWSKLWEYPWLWHHGLSTLDWRGLRVLDLGSEQSPFPWWLAAKGAHVTLIETRRDWIGQWDAVRTALGGVKVDWQIVDSCRLPFADESFDVVTSLSVIEHQDDKVLAAFEVGRVLKPGGRFGISFDICEPTRGMTFPEWNGRALTMDEFVSAIWNQSAFGNRTRPEWNREDIAPFLRWHRQTAPHHNYVTGAAVLKKQPTGLLARLRRWFA